MRLYNIYIRLRERIMRIGKARGFGIQSPWAFSFVTEVIGERWPYYGYEDIERIYKNRKEQEFQKLILRVRNFVYPDNLIVIDNIDDITDDMLKLTANDSGVKGALVIRGLYDTPDSLARWHEIQHHDNVGITFDLFDFGICFFDRDIIKQHYKLNF